MDLSLESHSIDWLVLHFEESNSELPDLKLYI